MKSVKECDLSPPKIPSNTNSKFLFPTRYVLPIMGFFGFFILNSMRLNLSLTILAMVNSTAVYASQEKIGINTTLHVQHTKEGAFLWSPKRQGTILGAYFWTLGVGCLIGGRLSEILGCKRVFGFGMLALSLLTLVTPSAANYQWYALAAIRGLTGFSQGITAPSVLPLLRKWIPASERSLMASITSSGLYLGSFVTILVTGYLCDSQFLGGWPSVYYLSGTVGCLWCILFKFLVYETPLEHPWIPDKELQHILSSNDLQSTAESPPIPWKSMCLSPAVWAFCLCTFAVRWAQFHFYTVHPTYMATILKYRIAENGVFSSFPHLLMMITVLVTGSVSDFFRRRKCVSISVIHKSCVTIGMLGFVVCILGVIGAGYDVKWNTALLILAMGFTGIASVGESVLPLDMSPHFAGTLIGFSGLLCTSTGFIIPTIVGVLTEKEQTMAQWRIIFYISIAVISVCSIGFDILGSAEIQPWDPINVVKSEDVPDSQRLNTLKDNPHERI